MSRKPRPKKRKPGKRALQARRRRRLRILQVLVMALLLCASYSLWIDHKLREDFENRTWDVAARVFARPLVLSSDNQLSRQRILFELDALGYRRASEPLDPGEFQERGSQMSIHARGHRFFDRLEPPRQLQLGFDAGRLNQVRERSGRDIDGVRLEPIEIGRIYPQHREDRTPLRLEETPVALQQALLAAEDRDFFTHHGLDPAAIARAAWANLRKRRIVQGGSTLTQQLVKNLYLGGERSWLRKVREALLAVLLERHYPKPVILQAYLNQVFLGQDGARAVHGFGLAAEFYFGRPLQELSVDEQALLVGLIKGPTYYDPRRHPKRAVERRNVVLRAMRSVGYLSEKDYARYSVRQLRLGSRHPKDAGQPDEYLQLVRRRLERNYNSRELRTRGLRVYTSYDPYLQTLLDSALESGLATISPDPELQAAALVVDYATGEVLALRGSRRTLRGGFNRALDASRPVGSLIKPAVYLAALEQPEHYFLHSPLQDTPVRLQVGSDVWMPRNYDRVAHGEVSLITALSRSHNLATVRLGLDIGLQRVKSRVRALGVDRALNDYPSLLLGAVEVTPLEVAQFYQTLANGGSRVPLNAVWAVVAPDGQRLTPPRGAARQAADPAAVFLVQRALQEAFVSGTARGARPRDPELVPIGGKTGTTNERRDSWFAGYAGELLSVVWLGRDDNQSTGLTGASGAAKIWQTFMNGAGPRPRTGSVPAGIAWYGRNDRGDVILGDCADAAGAWPYIAAAPPAGTPCDSRAQPLWRFLTDIF